MQYPFGLAGVGGRRVVVAKMTYALFVGCLLIAFGPPLALFWVVIRQRSALIVLTVGSTVFWLMGMLAASMVWFVLAPLREYFWFVITVTVLFIEISRYVVYRVHQYDLLFSLLHFCYFLRTLYFYFVLMSIFLRPWTVGIPRTCCPRTAG